MKKNNSLSKNAILNVIKTISSICFPLLTFPYISRILGVNNVGIYNFCTSVTSYITLFAGLGINTYAIREGSRLRNNKSMISKFSSEIFSINLLSTIFAYIVLFFCIITFSQLKVHYLTLVILSISILFTTLGCEWLFNIYEDFIFITLRSILFQIVSIFLLYTFVKNENDLVVYALITVIATSGSNLINLFARKKYCKIKFLLNKDLVKHIKPILLLFANSIAITIYINSDITLLGILSNNYYVGLYSASTKVYTTLKTLLGALITVSIPRLSSLIGEKKLKEYDENANLIMNSLIAISCPTVIGVFCLSDFLILLLYGKDYIMAGASLKILSFSLFFSIVSWFYTSCVLIPFRKDKKVLVATSISAIVNVVLNILFIRDYNIIAAATTTLIAEALSASICLYYGKSNFKIKLKKNNIFSVILGCVSIYLICKLVILKIESIILASILSITLSVLSYFIILFLFKNDFMLFIKDFFKKKSL